MDPGAIGTIGGGVGTVAFLGPEGTFTEEALLASLPDGGLHPFPYPSIHDTLQAVARGEAELGLVPIENSLEGSVALTLDLLAWGFDELRIVREVVHPIRHQLIAREPIELRAVTKVISHPHAYAQCRSFVREHLANVEYEAASSTAEAVRQVSRVNRPWVAIGNKLAADMYECVILHDDIEDSVDNRTRFVYLGRREAAQDLEANYKTSIVCGIARNQPGSLLLILQEFAHRYVNLTKVESRPSKRELGDYIFFIDMEGRMGDEAIGQALKCLACKLPWVKVLGSYPA
jgi:prephenate dehydratase